MKQGGYYGNPNGLYSYEKAVSDSPSRSISTHMSSSQIPIYVAMLDAQARKYINLLSKEILAKCSVDTADYEYKQSCQQEPLNLTSYLKPDDKIYQSIINYEEYTHIWHTIIKIANDSKSQVKLSGTIDRANNALAFTRTIPEDLRPYFQFSNGGYELNSQGLELVYTQSVGDIINKIASKVLHESIKSSIGEEMQPISEHEQEKEKKVSYEDDRNAEKDKIDKVAQKKVTPESEEDLMTIIEQLRVSLKQKDETISQQATQIEEKDETISQQATQIEEKDGQIGDLTRENTQVKGTNAQLKERLATSEEQNKDLRQDKSDLRKANLEKDAKLEEANKMLVIKQSQYDILKGQLDSIGLGIAQAPEVNQDSQLLVAGDNLSIDSFEVVNQ